MPRRLLIRGAQPLIPCTPLSRYRRYKSPCRAIFCLLSSNVPAEIISLYEIAPDLSLIATSPWRPSALSYSCCNRPPRNSLIFRAITALLNSPAAKWPALVLEHYSSTGTALPLSYLPATVEISLESPRAIAGSSGGSTPVSTYQTDNNNSSSQSSRTHLLDLVYRATTLCAHSKPLRQQRARRRPFLPTYLMCMWHLRATRARAYPSRARAHFTYAHYRHHVCIPDYCVYARVIVTCVLRAP